MFMFQIKNLRIEIPAWYFVFDLDDIGAINIVIRGSEIV